MKDLPIVNFKTICLSLRKENNMASINDLSLVKLRSISNEVELKMIEAILSDNSVPYIIKDEGAGGYMRIIGRNSVFATDVMVSEKDYERANELLESISID